MDSFFALAARGGWQPENESRARMRAPVARRAGEILAAIAHASRPSALRERSGADSDNARAAKVIDSRR